MSTSAIIWNDLSATCWDGIYGDGLEHIFICIHVAMGRGDDTNPLQCVDNMFDYVCKHRHHIEYLGTFGCKIRIFILYSKLGFDKYENNCFFKFPLSFYLQKIIYANLGIL